MVWLKRYLVDRWRFYRAMLCVNHQWQAIMRHLCLRFVIVESARDLGNYFRLVIKAKDEISDDAELVEFFRKTHVRVDIDALVLQPMLPACRSLEITHAYPGEYNRGYDGKPRTLDSWLRIPHLKIITIYHRFSNLGQVTSTIGPTVTHLQGRFVDSKIFPGYLPSWARLWLGQITHLRVSSPQPLIPFVEHTLNLEELTLDMPDPETGYYTIVAALKSGIFRKPKKTLILLTGPTEPVCYGPVSATCEQLGVVLERRVVYEEDRPFGLAVRVSQSLLFSDIMWVY